MWTLKRNKIITLLFIFYFVSYVISPLSYTLADDRPDPAFTWVRPVVDSFTTVSKSVRIFLWDQLCSNLVPKETGSDAPSTISFLVKKKRAVVRSNTLIKSLSVEYGAVNTGVLHLPAPDAFRTVAYYPKATSWQNFYLKPSGLSPPFSLA